MPIRVAAIGMTHWHSLYDSAYLRHLADMPDVDIVGIQDDNHEIARHRANEVGGGIPTFTDYRQMLGDVEPDFVLALGRHDTMADTAHYLLDNQIPFVMEKPMSYSARQLRGVVDKAVATNGFAAVPLGRRYSPFVQWAKRFVTEGTYGPMCHFYSRQNRPSPLRYAAWGAEWMLNPKIANGGCLRNLGNHGLDAFVYLTGEGENITVTGAQLSWSTHSQQVEDYASVLIESASGVLGTVEVGNAFPGDGTDGQWKVAFRDAILISNRDEVTLETADGAKILPPPDGSPSNVLRQTVEAAARGDEPPVSVRDCYLAVRLIDLAYIAAGNPYGTAEV
ncbi:MAG: Gfo/Idh/MocA family oxidoreductase [Chloroflexi bacterium]|nr:Gfo/Idh/MocA family oxidoreductase [Chloroflexota bacterium]